MINEFVHVTEHYGYVYERHPFFPEELLYVLYRADKPQTPRLSIGARRTRAAAVRECEYLEKLNASKFKKEDENNG